jgi:hypothetical protein
MIAKFSGTCARTGRAIKPGDIITFTAARKPVLVQQHVSDTIVFFGENGEREFYRNRNGRCEDAPCCGCCTI